MGFCFGVVLMYYDSARNGEGMLFKQRNFYSVLSATPLISVSPYSNLYFNLFTSEWGVNFALQLALGLFCVATLCFFFRVSSLLVALIFAELMFVGLFVGVLSVALLFGDAAGLLYPLYLLCTAAADSSIGLVLTLNAYRLAGSVSFTNLNVLRA